ncbi:MAG: PRC-barrel domain-containing protein, partial [Burkholderiales bacterium]
DVDKEALKNAPGFDKDNWPSMADNNWATQIHSYYGSRPYWEI